MCEKANSLDLSWLDQIDHKKPELTDCCLIMYVKDNMTGQMWSRSPAFAVDQFKIVYLFFILPINLAPGFISSVALTSKISPSESIPNISTLSS
jgi:hypothetical protein